MLLSLYYKVRNKHTPRAQDTILLSLRHKLKQGVPLKPPSLNRRQISIISATSAGIVALVVVTILLSNITRPNNASIEVDNLIYSIDSQPNGLDYSEWAIEWWRWYLSISKEDSPALDTTGESCTQNQNNPHVWFLAGTFGGSAERECTVPSDKALFVPLINVACSYAYFPSLKTEEELRQCALEENESVYEKKLSIDGVEIRDLDKYLVVSPAFNITLPDNNLWDVPPNTETTAVTAGYYILMKPLTPGDHTIQYGGAAGNPAISGEENFATSVTLHINSE